MKNNIPAAESILVEAKAEEVNRHELWLSRTVLAVQRLIEKRRDTLRNGDNVNFFFPALRDRGYGIQEWRQHYQEVVELIKEKNFHVEVIQTGYPPSPVLIISIAEAKNEWYKRFMGNSK